MSSKTTGGASKTLRADHVGSFLRPPELLEAKRAHAAGRLSEDALREAEDQAILKILETQRQVGLEIFSDGEYRRDIYSGAIAESVEGLVPSGDVQFANTASAWHGPNSKAAVEALQEIRPEQLVAGARLKLKRRIAGQEAGFLAEYSPGPWKTTLTPPQAGQIWKPGLSDQHYGSVQELQAELTQIYMDEIGALIHDGASYVQLDSLSYVIAFGDPSRRQEMIKASVALDNALVDGQKREGVTFALHMCRGNNRGHWMAEGGYEPAAEAAFGGLHVDRFLLEYDSERAGGFEPLRFVPKDKVVALGLISTKVPELESQDDLLRRIDEASKYVPIENLALAPQCGFASVFQGNPLSWDDQRRKLELLVSTARKVWG
jgi:5-methyltetrahydropteroyltriglutamate--homocysteine methyltransferase